MTVLLPVGSILIAQIRNAACEVSDDDREDETQNFDGLGVHDALSSE
jgi:hypothetical protein